MEKTMSLGVVNGGIKEKLVSITEPKNAILARLQNGLTGNKNDRVVCSYSRMHNRHNRS